MAPAMRWAVQALPLSHFFHIAYGIAFRGEGLSTLWPRAAAIAEGLGAEAPSANQVRRRLSAWFRAELRSRIGPVNPHMLRHTHATALAKAGWTSAEIAARLGQRSAASAEVLNVSSCSRGEPVNPVSAKPGGGGMLLGLVLTLLLAPEAEAAEEAGLEYIGIGRGKIDGGSRLKLVSNGPEAAAR